MFSAFLPRQTTVLLVALTLSCGIGLANSVLWAQDAPVNIATSPDTINTETSDENALAAEDIAQPEFSLLSLILKGGVLMVPILIMSVVVITLVIERFLSLREHKILPKDLVSELGQLASSQQGFDPKRAYRLCQSYPSSASTVIRSMLLKVGRPQSEVERTVAEASDREASRLYGNVRWLNLAAAVAPLMGLFGTVWGMIRAFFDTTQLQAGQNKADFLAEGIYVALVTTLGGLAVAIPAAIFAHYFEGRIQQLFYRIEELLFNLMPQVEKFEGRLRMSHQTLNDPTDSAAPTKVKRSPSPTTST